MTQEVARKPHRRLTLIATIAVTAVIAVVGIGAVGRPAAPPPRSNTLSTASADGMPFVNVTLAEPPTSWSSQTPSTTMPAVLAESATLEREPRRVGQLYPEQVLGFVADFNAGATVRDLAVRYELSQRAVRRYMRSLGLRR